MTARLERTKLLPVGAGTLDRPLFRRDVEGAVPYRDGLNWRGVINAAPYKKNI